MSKPYIGQKIQLNLTVENVSRTFPGFWFQGYTVEGSADDETDIHADFPSKWKIKVTKLRKGDKIIVGGEISDLSYGVSLEDCKILPGNLVPDLKKESSHGDYSILAKDEMPESDPIEELGSMPQGPVYTKYSPKELRDIVRGLTELKRKELSEPYIGKKMQLRISVNDVYKNFSNEICVFGEAEDETSIWADFDNKWRDRLKKINPGEEIIVDGEIESLRNGVNLCNCKIMIEGLVPDL